MNTDVCMNIVWTIMSYCFPLHTLSMPGLSNFFRSLPGQPSPAYFYGSSQAAHNPVGQVFGDSSPSPFSGQRRRQSELFSMSTSISHVSSQFEPITEWWGCWRAIHADEASPCHFHSFPINLSFYQCPPPSPHSEPPSLLCPAAVSSAGMKTAAHGRTEEAICIFFLEPKHALSNYSRRFSTTLNPCPFLLSGARNSLFLRQLF